MEKKENNIISQVISDSLAYFIGIESGDILLKINEQKVTDVIEYIYLTTEEYIELDIRKNDGSIKKYKIHKEYDEDIGIIFDNPIIDKAKVCSNKCIFCFIDQLPSNMRETLYFKDDDSRLSFLQGNFITLTNMTEKDINKIIKYRISPINVSIHTTDQLLRMKMLNNRFAGNIMERLERLSKARIEINGQIVLCRDINDKKELDKTISDIYKLYPSFNSLAVVPVGLTKFRENLYSLTSYDRFSAQEVIEQIEIWQEKLLEIIGSRFVYLSDEFYLLAERELPKYENYEGFSQLENGVGLIRKFEHDFLDNLSLLDKIKGRSIEISMITGKSAKDFMDRIIAELHKKNPCIRIRLHAIKNCFFGDSITVSGLITGQDIITQLKNSQLGEVIIVPTNMLNSDEKLFLDDLSIEDIEKALGVPVFISPVDGRKFIEKIADLII